MSETVPEPLWREVVGDTEPWRRGRIILIVFAVLTLLNQAFLFTTMALNGAFEVVLVFAIGAALFWLLFYLIWIGVHWVRWLSAFCWGAWGFALLIWAFRDSNVLEMFSGSYAVLVAACLGFVPSVYFFAQRQRETKRLLEMIGVAVVVLMLVASLAMGIFGLSAYKLQIQREACSFADEAFQRIFARHDTYFFLDVASDDLMQKEGRLRLTKFLQHEYIYGGDVHDIQPATTFLWFSYAFPVTLVAQPRLRLRAKACGDRLSFTCGLSSQSETGASTRSGGLILDRCRVLRKLADPAGVAYLVFASLILLSWRENSFYAGACRAPGYYDLEILW